MQENFEIPPQKKESLLTKRFAEISKVASQLHEAGASLRLISALMGTRSYGTVYRAILGFSERTRRGGCGQSRPTTDSQIQVSSFYEKYPDVHNSMKKRCITLRRWCSAYGFIRDAGGADLYMLSEPLISDYYSPDEFTKPVRPIDLLKEDFPEAFEIKIARYGDMTWESGYPRYDFLAIDPSLYWRDKKMRSKNGGFNHICLNEEMSVFVVTPSMASSRAIFTKRIRQEICIRRMKMLLETGIDNAESLNSALKWLPKTERSLQAERKRELASKADHGELFAREGALKREFNEIKNRSWKKNNDETRMKEINEEIIKLRQIRVAIAHDIDAHHKVRRERALNKSNRETLRQQ